MKRALFLCNTHFQCITAITIKLTKYANEEVDIIISDYMKDSKKLYQRIKEIGIFGDVYHISVRDCFSKKKNFKYYINVLNTELRPEYWADKIGIKSDYESFFTYNTDPLAESIFYKLRKKNSNTAVSLYDEGYSTYTSLYQNSLFGKTVRLNILRSVFNFLGNRKHIIDFAQDIFLFDPDLLCWNVPFKINKIDSVKKSEEYYEILNKVFGFEELKDSYDRNVIFFEESYYWDNRPIDDLKMVEYLAKKIGKNRIMIKLHPRNRVNRFNKLKYTTNNEVGIPWEIIAMNMKNYTDKLFVTYTSGSVISYRILFEKKFKSIMLFDCMQESNSNINESSKMYFEKFSNKYNEDFFIPKNLKELDVILETFEKSINNA